MSLSTKLTLANGLVVDQPTGLFINGEFVSSKSGKTFETVNPTTEEVICAVSEADEADVNAAVDAAHAAFRTWGFKTAPSDRAAVLFKLADLIERDLDIIAALETTDNGKVYAHAKGDVALVCKVIRYYAGYADKIYGDVIHGNDGHFSYTRKEPIGVCGQIIPWNFPLVMWSWKIAPALATGNTVVLKSAESTPLSALYAAKLAQEAGLPAGVLNILSGYGQVGALMTNHPKIRKVAFTGSTATGKQVLKSAALSNLKKISLELGGKSPNIIFDDANLPNAISWAALGIFFNSGEVCAAASRLYVQEGVYDEVVAALKTRAEALVVGDPFDQKTFQGAQTSKLQFDRVMSFIEAGKAEGATLLTGGCRAQDKGYFIRPTVFTDVKKDMKIVQEEIFGPVVVVTKFKTLEEVIELANDSEYGLAAGVHTQDISRAHYLAENLHAGTVWVNTYNSFHISLPFGGFNQSGFGKEMGKDGLDSYIQTKAVRIMFDQAKLQ